MEVRAVGGILREARKQEDAAGQLIPGAGLPSFLPAKMFVTEQNQR